MNNDNDTLFYESCQRRVTFHRQIVDHRKELIRALCSLGLWLPFWLSMTLGKAKLCDHCDSSLWTESNT